MARQAADQSVPRLAVVWQQEQNLARLPQAPAPARPVCGDGSYWAAPREAAALARRTVESDPGKDGIVRPFHYRILDRGS